MTNKQTANAFAIANSYGNAPKTTTAKNANGSLYFIGDTIYSYGYHFPIARIIQGNNPTVLFTTRKYSVTTAKHKNDVMRALQENGYNNIMLVENVIN